MACVNLRKLNVILFIIILFIVLIPGYGSESDENGTQQSSVSVKPISNIENLYFDPGTIVTYDFELKNEGERKTFFIEVSSESGWTISLVKPTEASVTLGPDNTEEISVEIEIPEQVAEGDYEFVITISSKSLLYQKFIHAIVTPDGVIITAVVKPVLIISSFKSQLGTVTPGETLEVDIKVRSYVTSANVQLQYEVNKFIDFAPEKNLVITSEPEWISIDTGKYETCTLTIQFPEKFNRRANYSCIMDVKAVDVISGAESKSTTLRFLVWNVPKDNNNVNILTSPVALAGISIILIIGACGAAISSNEAGKYLLLSVIFIPLYTKLHKEKILDHFTRGRVYEYIRSNPGVHYSEIKRELDLNNGNLTYHLHTLEREALIKSRTKGRFKVFYPMDVKIPADMEPQISSFRSQLLDIIREHPGISQKELGALLPNKKQRTISYHIKTMSREGVLRLEKVGRETQCYITKNVIDMKVDSSSEDRGETDKYSTKYIENDTIFRQI